MQRERKLPLLVRWRRKYQGRYDAVSMIVYLFLVYGWAFRIGPLGRDFEAFGTAGEGMPPVLGVLWRCVSGFCGPSTGAYIAFNLVLLYASMLLVYRLANRAIRGQWWLGTLAALLFMANPVHSEAVLNLSGMVDLVPCVLALAAIEAYASLGAVFAPAKAILALALFTAAVFVAPANAGLFLVLVLWEWLIVEEDRRSWRRLLPFLYVAGAALYFYWPFLGNADHRFSQMWAPLYFILYPIGFLPESAQRFHEHPSLGWLAGLTVAVMVLLIYAKARRPAILFGLLAVLAVRLYPGDRVVDPVHLVGGGQLMLASALLNVALAGLFYRIMDHPRWRIPIVSGTSLLAVVLFMLMWRVQWAWTAATEEVRAFRAEAQRAAQSGQTVGVLPDYRYRLTAPICLSESITYDTPFSRAVPHASLLPLHQPGRVPPHVARDTQAAFRVEQWGARDGVVSVGARDLQALAPWPYDLIHAGGVLEGAEAVVESKGHAEDGRVRLEIRPKRGALPGTTLPAR